MCTHSLPIQPPFSFFFYKGLCISIMSKLVHALNRFWLTVNKSWLGWRLGKFRWGNRERGYCTKPASSLAGDDVYRSASGPTVGWRHKIEAQYTEETCLPRPELNINFCEQPCQQWHYSKQQEQMLMSSYLHIYFFLCWNVTDYYVLWW